ncbi:response regulator transcription factor [Yoonia vestfoldensis]|jgi:two-component system OmpR family response regulator|uniref:Transcriptional regulatory protein QseB n=1 Tax=Yoonia vestfoldensis TaxID=245188 RepID=A0A1Y0E7W1_9RHOB|nr:response regulator transcription factor [Yoonia vestfoldensis]ART99499.1 transcriptional regulatory protein QseB [Yoonia vestfoldensis]
MRILLVEDEPMLAQQINTVLVTEGYAVDIADDGITAERLALLQSYDTIVLDMGLPGRDGMQVLRNWRAAGMRAPVLILSARDGWTERVDGLDAGADDYLTKPFHMPELCARLRAMIRRKSDQPSPVFEQGDVLFDSRINQVMRAGKSVRLTAQEMVVLAYLFHNAGRLVSRSELSQHLYHHDGERESNTIAVFINRLRKKLGDSLIDTVRGRGYMIKAPE